MPLQYELAWLLKERYQEIGITPLRLAKVAAAQLDTVQQLLGGNGATSVATAAPLALRFTAGVCANDTPAGSSGSEDQRKTWALAY